MASETTTTTDHDEIRRWVEEHGGSPARVVVGLSTATRARRHRRRN